MDEIANNAPVNSWYNIKPRLVVGLGNRGAEYAPTRHNAGIWFLQALVHSYGKSFVPDRALPGLRAEINGCCLFIPSTVMNASGQAVHKALAHLEIPATALVIAHDDADLPPGMVKCKYKCSSAYGHNGVSAITRTVKTNFWRIRIGVGRANNNLAKYLLSPPGSSERTLINHSLARVIAHWDCLANGRWKRAMTSLHTKNE